MTVALCGLPAEITENHKFVVVDTEIAAVRAQALLPTQTVLWPSEMLSLGLIPLESWLPLQGTDVLLWPTNLDAAREDMVRVGVALKRVTDSVRFVQVTDADGYGFSAAAMGEWSKEQLIAWAKARVTVFEVPVPPMPAMAEIYGDPPSDADLVIPESVPEEPFTFHTPVEGWFKNVPPRQFLYRRHYMRGMVGVTAAAGGAGKSSVVMVELVSMALGRDLLNQREELPVGPLQVWYHNGEDPKDEIRRRLAAICLHYSIDPEELKDRFFFTVGRENPLIVARDDPKFGTLCEPQTVKDVTAAMLAKKIDILAIDPFISTHRVSENSNDAMEVVMSQWRAIADNTSAAIEAVHHFRKSNGNEASVDDIRGASAMIGAARSARIFATMSAEEATRQGIPPEERRRFVWEGQAKANMYVASDRRIWRELISVDLCNGQAPYASDSVGVAADWHMPDNLTAMSDELFPVIIGAIRAEIDPMKRRVSVIAKGWIGHLICQVLDVDVDSPGIRQQIQRQVEAWTRSEVLVIEQARDPKQSKNVDCYVAPRRTDS